MVTYYKLLIETGDYLLLETGDKILLESVFNASVTISAKANIIGPNALFAKGNIKETITKSVSAKATIQKSFTQIITAKGVILRKFTQTIIAKASIYVPIEEIIRLISAKIEIQWDGVSWTDESTYFLSAQGNEKLTGLDGRGIASTLDIEVDNTDERFTPDNTSSPLSGYIKPHVPIRVSVIIGIEYKMFTGYIKNIHPNMKARICSLECFDNQVLVYNKEANGVVYEDYRSDQLLTVLAGLADLKVAQYSFDVGLYTVNFGYFGGRNVWPVMGEVAVAERGRIFFNRDGILTFWNRDRLHNLGISYTLTLDDWITDLDYSVAEHEIKNAVTVQAKPRASAGIQVVWSNGNVEYLDPYSDTLVLVPAYGTQAAWLELEDPCSTFITPVRDTDFIANSEQDGSGSDLSANITVTDFTNYGDAVYLNVLNTGATNAYLTTFQIRGNPVRVLKYIRITAEDDTSISLYGRQKELIENDFIQDEGGASEIAYEELWRRQDAINLFSVDIIGIPYLLCGDVVSVEYIAGTYKNAMIDKIDWTLDDGGFKQKLTLIDPYVFPEIQRISARATIA